MAQTYKFGNGTWATKKGSTLAYNDENDNYKPLPFTTTRESRATRVNKEGLIEVVGNDVPRIDYTDSTEGVLLLEPQRTNLITYSEDFSDAYWTKSGVSLTDGFISPDGTSNAFKLIEDGTNAFHGFYQNANISLPIGKITMSIFVKANGRDYFQLRTGSAAGITGAPLYANFDLTNDSVTATSSGVNDAKIESYTNNWKKISISFTITSGSSASLVFQPITTSSAAIGETYQGDGTSGVYIYGAQLEQGSYPTSYIPTNGSTVTRLADAANGSGNSEVFNDSEGVLFADIAALANDGNARRISISDGSSSNNVYLSCRATANQVRANISGSYDKTITISDVLLYGKLLIKYKSGDISFWVNGFEVDASTSSISLSGLNTLNFDGGLGFQDFYGKTKEIAYYDEILTDEELETLTSYRSLNELVTELNLNTL